MLMMSEPAANNQNQTRMRSCELREQSSCLCSVVRETRDPAPRELPSAPLLLLWLGGRPAVADDDGQIKRQASADSLCKQDFRIQPRQRELGMR
jgi:hypothetical protein